MTYKAWHGKYSSATYIRDDIVNLKLIGYILWLQNITSIPYEAEVFDKSRLWFLHQTINDNEL